MAMHKVNIETIIEKKPGYRSMAIPSVVHSYSVCIEYLRKWFLSKFEPGFFSSSDGSGLYIAGRHAFDDFRRQAVGNLKEKDSRLNKISNSASLSCKVNLDYDREKVDLYPFGTELYLKRHTNKDAFFRDEVNNLYLSHDFEILEVQADFKVELRTRALQFDMYKYIKLMFRVGATQGEYISYDQHVPYGIMLQIAKDAGFNTANGKIVDIMAFLRYLNMNSIVPFMYKFRNINGKDEFFIRIKNAYVHIAIPDMDFDDGERVGQYTNDYSITFTATVRFPVTKCYVYYSQNKHTEITLKEPVDGAVCFTTIRMIDAPDFNEKHWKKMLSTEYEDDKVTDEKTTIDISDLVLTGDLGRVIKTSTAVYLDPSMFIDVKFFNNGKEIPFTINWYNGICESYQPLDTTRTTIVVYLDMEYVNNQLRTLDELTNRGRLH